MNGFLAKINKIVKKNSSLVCVGLDSDINKIPKHLLKYSDPVFQFNKEIIEATNDLVCAYKPNIAFYEAAGIEGLRSLKKTNEYLVKKYSEIPIIIDAKRGDIDNTNLSYIANIFNELKADAVTLHPYLGQLSLKPFLDLKDKFYFILCRTSNPGAQEFQDLKVKGQYLYQYVAKQVVIKWNINNNCGLVVGATYPKELKMIRKIAGDMWFLIPGVGAQGGDVEKTVKAGKDNHGMGMVINSSRGIIYVSDGKDFALTARKEALKLKELINNYR